MKSVIFASLLLKFYVFEQRTVSAHSKMQQKLGGGGICDGRQITALD